MRKPHHSEPPRRNACANQRMRPHCTHTTKDPPRDASPTLLRRKLPILFDASASRGNAATLGDTGSANITASHTLQTSPQAEASTQHRSPALKMSANPRFQPLSEEAPGILATNHEQQVKIPCAGKHLCPRNHSVCARACSQKTPGNWPTSRQRRREVPTPVTPVPRQAKEDLEEIFTVKARTC